MKRMVARSAAEPGGWSVRTRTTATLAVMLLVGAPDAGSAQTISRSVIGCGGNAMTGAAYAIVGTLGQAVVGRTTDPGEPEPFLCSGWWCGEYGTVVGALPSGPQTPHVTRMAPPAPNPARGIVRLVYELARDARVELTVYSVAGARVRSLVRETRAAGRHEIQWDGRAEGGAMAGSGVYFGVLRVDGRSVVQRRIVLVR